MDERLVGNEGQLIDYDQLCRSVVILSDYRTGSHMLKLSLCALTQMAGPEEPFGRYADGGGGRHGEGVLPDHSLDALVLNGQLSVTDLLTAPKGALPGCLGLMQAIVARDRGTAVSPIFFDLKYDQVYRLGAESPGRSPTLLHWFIDNKLPVLHVIRRDALAQAISFLIAKKRRVYVELHGKAPKQDHAPEPLYLDPDQAVAYARAYMAARRDMQAQLTAMRARVLTVAYEDMIGDGLAPQLRRCLRFIDRWVDVPARLRPGTTSQESRSRVLNLTELIDAALAADPELVGSIV